jgi:hypothetical protein
MSLIVSTLYSYMSTVIKLGRRLRCIHTDRTILCINCEDKKILFFFLERIHKYYNA